MTAKRQDLTRRAFCTDIAATVAVAIPPFSVSSAEKTEGLKPLIKYRGGKAKEFVQYGRFIPRDFETYYEPFVGGGATFFKLMPQKAVIGDINEPLINFYREVRDRFDDLSKELATIQALYEKNQRAYREKKKKAPISASRTRTRSFTILYATSTTDLQRRHIHEPHCTSSSTRRPTPA